MQQYAEESRDQEPGARQETLDSRRTDYAADSAVDGMGSGQNQARRLVPADPCFQLLRQGGAASIAGNTKNTLSFRSTMPPPRFGAALGAQSHTWG
jgi:hypothetical protein